MDGIEHEFTRAVEAIKNVGSNSGVTVSDTQKIKCYGLFKQATEGDCKKAQPSVWQPVERAKWNGWNSLQGIDSIVAKRRYVALVMEIIPTFQVSTSLKAAIGVHPTSQIQIQSQPNGVDHALNHVRENLMSGRCRENSTNGYVQEFERAVEVMNQAVKRKEITINNAQKVKLHGLYKQATEGDCRKPQPSMCLSVIGMKLMCSNHELLTFHVALTERQERAKWNGWMVLEGMDSAVAKQQYVLQVMTFVPKFQIRSPEVAMPSSPTLPDYRVVATNSNDHENALSGYENEFTRASAVLKSTKDVSLTDAQKLTFYGLYKQATEGNCNTAQPGVLRPVERAKWNEWKGLSGTASIVAKQRYVELVAKFVPSFEVAPADLLKSSDFTSSNSTELRKRLVLVSNQPKEILKSNQEIAKVSAFKIKPISILVLIILLLLAAAYLHSI